MITFYIVRTNILTPTEVSLVSGARVGGGGGALLYSCCSCKYTKSIQ